MIVKRKKSKVKPSSYCKQTSKILIETEMFGNKLKMDYYITKYFLSLILTIYAARIGMANTLIRF